MNNQFGVGKTFPVTIEKPRIRAYSRVDPPTKVRMTVERDFWSIWYVDTATDRVYRVDAGLTILFQEWKDLRLFEVPYVGY